MTPLSSIASAQDKGRRQMITDPPLIKLKNSRVQKFTKKKDNNASTISMTPLSSIALAQIREGVK